MQTTSLRIWSRVAEFASDVDNCYTSMISYVLWLKEFPLIMYVNKKTRQYGITALPFWSLKPF